VRLLVQKLPLDSLEHEVFGSPLTNAIKLGDLEVVKQLFSYISCSQLTARQQEVMLKESLAAFPIMLSVYRSIIYSRDTILVELAKLMRQKFRQIKPTQFNIFIGMVARNSNVRVLRSLFRFQVQLPWTLSYEAMCALCKTEDYEMIHFAFLNANCKLIHVSSQRHSFHIAVRSGIEAARAVYDTGKYVIDERVSCTFPSYWNDPVTALDVAIFWDDTATIKWLLDQGADYRRRFPISRMSGRIYNHIRNQAIRDDPRMVDLPPYGQYKDMSEDAKMGFTFDLIS
jgi:hypothetical protein